MPWVAVRTGKKPPRLRRALRRLADEHLEWVVAAIVGVALLAGAGGALLTVAKYM